MTEVPILSRSPQTVVRNRLVDRAKVGLPPSATASKRLILIVISAAALSLTFAGSASSRATAPTDLSYTYRNVEVIESPVPLPDIDAVQRSDFDLRHAAAELVDFNKAEFAGTYVDTDGIIVLVASSEKGDALARALIGDRLDARVERSTVSLEGGVSTGLDIVREIPEMWETFGSAGLDPAQFGSRRPSSGRAV